MKVERHGDMTGRVRDLGLRARACAAPQATVAALGHRVKALSGGRTRLHP